MVLLVCGSRTCTDQEAVAKVIRELHEEKGVTLLVEGGARGADRCARLAAIALNIPYKTEHAHWDTYGKAAGPIRNQSMLDTYQPDYYLAFVDGETLGKGTGDMVHRLKRAGISGETHFLAGKTAETA